MPLSQALSPTGSCQSYTYNHVHKDSTHVHTCMCTNTLHTCMHVLMHICTQTYYTDAYIQMHTLHTCIYIYTCINTLLTCTHTNAQTYNTHAYMYTNTLHAYVHVHTYKYHMCVYAYTCACAHHAHMHVPRPFLGMCVSKTFQTLHNILCWSSHFHASFVTLTTGAMQMYWMKVLNELTQGVSQCLKDIRQTQQREQNCLW